MKLTNAKVELACGKGDIRYYLNQPYLEVEAKRIVSTNGHILAVVQVEPEEGDTTGAIPLDAIKRARSKDGKGELILNGSAIAGGASFNRPEIEKFPDYRKILPEKPDREPDITLDAALLYDLARALSEGGNKGYMKAGVSLWIKDSTSPVYVEPMSGDNFGVIMPLRR